MWAVWQHGRIGRPGDAAPRDATGSVGAGKLRPGYSALSWPHPHHFLATLDLPAWAACFTKKESAQWDNFKNTVF